MICRFSPSHSMFKHALFTLHNSSPYSWFAYVRKICQKYSLQDPLIFLSSPLNKERFKSLVKKAVVSYWHERLCEMVSLKPSLKLMRPQFLPLGKSPHPIWISSKHSPSATKSATLQAKILVGTMAHTDVMPWFQGGQESQKAAHLKAVMLLLGTQSTF